MNTLSFCECSHKQVSWYRPIFDKFAKRCGIARLAHTAREASTIVKRSATSQHAQQQQIQDISNPDLDDIELTQDDYEEQGLDTEVSQSEADDLDPEGRPARLEDFYVPRESTPQALVTELYSDLVYGPPAVVLAGFRAEEFAMVRAILDFAGGHDVKVIPCKEDMLFERMDLIIRLPEPDWASARPEGWTRGGSWGSQRTILFSGMKLAAQAALVELLEEAGLPPVCAALAVAEDADKQLGAVLAEAVQAQRSRRNPRHNLWEGMDNVATELPDIGDYLKSRAQEIQQDMEAGNLDRVTVGADGPDRTLADAQDSLLLHGDDGCSGEASDNGPGKAPAVEDPSAAAGSLGAEVTAAASSTAERSGQFAVQSMHTTRQQEPGQAAIGRLAADMQPPGPSNPAAAPGSGNSPAARPSAAHQPPSDRQPPPPPPVGRRPEQAPARLELRDAVLSDPATPGAAAALLGGALGGSPPNQQQAAELERVRAHATAAGKSFMDGLAQNVGLAGDAGAAAVPDAGGSGAGAAWAGAAAGQPGQRVGGPAGGAGSIESLIDDIAAGGTVPPVAPDVAPPPKRLSSHGAHAAEEGCEAGSSGRETDGGATAKSGDGGSVRMFTSSQGKERVAQDIMEEVDKKVERMRQETDRDKVTTEMRSEAWEPTRDAIKAALACGVGAADLRAMVDEEAAAREADAEGWAAAWGAVPPLMPSAEEVAAARAAGLAGGGRRPGYADILSPQAIPRGGAPGETVSAGGVYLDPQQGRAGAPGGRAGGGRRQGEAAGSGEAGGSDRAAGGGVGMAGGGAAGAGEQGGQGGNMTQRQLRELAQRRGLDYEALLRDAAAQGIVLAEG